MEGGMAASVDMTAPIIPDQDFSGLTGETGLAVLSRLGSRPSLDHLFSDLLPPPFPQMTQVTWAGSVGESNAVTSFLVDLMVTTSLPKSQKWIAIGGCEAGIILLNTDHHVKIIRDGGVWRFKAGQKEFKKEGERFVTTVQKVISADSVEKCSLIVAEHIKSNIKRVLMKHPHGLAYQKFRRAYLDTIGNNLEAKSLESFFKSPGIGDMVQLKQEAGEVVVMPSLEITNNIMSHMDKRKDVMGSRNELIQQELASDRRVGDFIEVIVTEVVSPHRFWVRLNGNTSEAMDHLMDQMDTFYYSGKSKEYKIPDEQVTAGLLCATLFLDGTWHRANITEIIDKNHVEVFFLDYGTPAKVRMEALRYLHKNFGELPGQAIQARLAGVKPVKGMARFSKEASGRFLQLIKSSPEGGRVVAAVGELKPKLILWLMDTHHVKGGLPVSQILVEEGLVEVDDQTMGPQVKIVETKRDHISKLLNEP